MNNFGSLALKFLRLRGHQIITHRPSGPIIWPKYTVLKALVETELGMKWGGSKKEWTAKMAAVLESRLEDMRRKSGENRRIRLVSEQPHVSQKQIDSFYESWEWKRLRYDFLKGKNRRCQCCGATAENGSRIVIDHVKPIRRYWNLRLDIGNLQILCDDCNMGKGSRDTTDWRPERNDMIVLPKFTVGNDDEF